MTEPGGTAGCKLAAAAAPAPITAGQSATTNMTAGDVGSVQVTLPSNVTAGDALVLAVDSNPASPMPTVSSVSGGGVTWTKGVSAGYATVGDDEIWYGLASSGGSGTSTITITMTGSTDTLAAWVGELSGVAGSGALDTTGTNTGNSTSVSARAMTTTVNGDPVLSAANSFNSDSSPPAFPFTDVAGPQQANAGEYTNPGRADTFPFMTLSKGYIMA